MPLVSFIEETMELLGTDADEALVEQAKILRMNQGPNEGVFVTKLNEMMSGQSIGH
ncbi:hypothetical protein ACWHAM_05845 [Paenibacillus terrae]|uniref:hypothetical protein n=1 Tax=Paenibacillus terrae TaxID=159743 RepID=UPI0002EAABE7|nr:hypothetical protein [Paenibacillus terrae]